MGALLTISCNETSKPAGPMKNGSLMSLNSPSMAETLPFPIIDLFNNEVISYSISERPTMPMIDDMLIKAFARLDAGTNPVLHSDQGWQYRHRWYQYQLRVWHRPKYVPQRQLPR
jgi:transposase InsO family protein